jgi:hypothetical protein
MARLARLEISDDAGLAGVTAADQATGHAVGK